MIPSDGCGYCIIYWTGGCIMISRAHNANCIKGVLSVISRIANGVQQFVKIYLCKHFKMEGNILKVENSILKFHPRLKKSSNSCVQPQALIF